jgi:hypothetical protein
VKGMAPQSTLTHEISNDEFAGNEDDE